MAKTATMVRVTAKDIRTGVPGDCFLCAVARALQRATGDSEANVYESSFVVYLQVWSRHIVAPLEVRRFSREFDGLDRTRGGRARLPKPDDYPQLEHVRPFTFELPPLSDPAWREACSCCEELCDAAALDDEGVCPECQE